nr:MAG TPA: hypothetical protein [Caudoviricetes sp.]
MLIVASTIGGIISLFIMGYPDSSFCVSRCILKIIRYTLYRCEDSSQ